MRRFLTYFNALLLGVILGMISLAIVHAIPRHVPRQIPAAMCAQETVGRAGEIFHHWNWNQFTLAIPLPPLKTR
jgi:hypothetical protein